MTEDWDTRALASIGAYLRTGLAGQAVTEMAPLRRCVIINPTTWLSWFRDCTWHDVATQMVLDLPEIQDRKGRTRRSVDRPKLQELSLMAVDRASNALVRLFVATMLWGSGTSNGRGPRYTAAALNDKRLPATLADTAIAVADGHLREAHERFRVAGVGASFFTKWFWTVGLATTSELAPLIFDTRVRGTLHALTGSTWAAMGRNAADSYDDYLRRAHRWAAELARDPSAPGIDAEKIEWLLFDRDHLSHSCLLSWLQMTR